MKVISITFIVFCCMIMLSTEAHESCCFNRDYHHENNGKNAQGDKWVSRSASDSDSPLSASGSTATVARERRPHVPHQHEWSASGSVSCSDEDYEGGWYTYANAGDNLRLPRSDNDFEFQGTWSYPVNASDLERGVKDPAETIDECSMSAWIYGRDKYGDGALTEKSAYSFIPFH